MTLQTLSAWIINLKCEPGAEALMRKLMEIWRAEAKESVDSIKITDAQTEQDKCSINRVK